MSSLLVNSPDMGLNALLPQTLRDPREAGDNAQNILYEYGLAKTPYGFAKLDLTTTGLNSGDTVLSVFGFDELDKYGHLIAVTTEKIYEHDNVNSEWDDKTQSGITMASDIEHPISYVLVGHNDTDIYLDDDSARANSYYHIVVCDGGMSNIQRWAGRYETDFADLTMTSGDYGTGQTTHRAHQVGAFKSRLILISPLTYSSTSSSWTENNQDIRWPTVGKIQTYTGTGSGFAKLIDTGGTNVWSALLGLGQYIIYQTQGIWSLNYVGGTTVFDPKPMIPDLGLLAPHLLISYNNVHYFVGTDYNVYAYYGGTVKNRIGDKIHKYLEEELAAAYESRCWMSMDERGKRFWIFIVPSGSTYITKAYGYDLRSQTWMVRDFSDKWSSGGITAVGLVSAQSHIAGDTYAGALATLSAYDAADDTATTAGDTTIRYGDLLYDSTNQIVDWSVLDETLDFTQMDFTAGGLGLCFTTTTGDVTELVADDTDYSNMIMRIVGGAGIDDMPRGAHYYTMSDICAVIDGAGYVVRIGLEPCESTGTAAADTSSDTPSIANDATATDGTVAATIFDPSGVTYRQALQEVRTQPTMMLGDTNGFIYKFDSTYSDYDSVSIVARQPSPVFDWGEPDRLKRWPGFSVVAEGTDAGAMLLRYRTSDFDTSDTGWTDVTFDLTSNYLTKDVWLNRSSLGLQLELRDFSGNAFDVQSFKIHEPVVEANR